MAKTSNIILSNGRKVKIQVKETNYGDGCGDIVERITDIAQNTLKDAVADIGILVCTTAESIKDSVNSLNAESITVTAGVALTTEGNLILVKGSTEVNFEISVTFKAGE